MGALIERFHKNEKNKKKKKKKERKENNPQGVLMIQNIPLRQKSKGPYSGKNQSSMTAIKYDQLQVMGKNNWEVS